MILSKQERYVIYEKNYNSNNIINGGVISTGFYSFENGYNPKRGSLLKRQFCFKSDVGDIWINPE